LLCAKTEQQLTRISDTHKLNLAGLFLLVMGRRG